MPQRKSRWTGLATAWMLTLAGTAPCLADQPSGVPSPPAPQTSQLPQVTPSPQMTPASQTTPSPQPSSSGLSLGPLTVDGVFSAFSLFTERTNPTGSLDTPTGADRSSRTDVSNAFVILNKNSGVFRYGFAAGAYNIPVVGFALNPTTQSGANTSLYGAVPSMYVEYAPSSSFNLIAGKLATFAGQENTYTYENSDIQRGVIWNLETAVSRGIRGVFSGAKFNAALELDDGYYSGNRLGLEGEVTNTPCANATFEFVWVLPNSSAPPNATTSIANKRLYNPLVTFTTGKWTFSPYLLFVDSPASTSLGYVTAEHAFGAVFNAAYALNATWSLPLRVEYGDSGGSTTDRSPNANLLGFGPASQVWTYTLTPTYRRGIFFARAEGSLVDLARYARGAGFGTNGLLADQVRSGVETGVQF